MKNILLTESQLKTLQEAIAENKLLPRLPLSIIEDIRQGNTPFSNCPAFPAGSIEKILSKAYGATVQEFSDNITSYSETEVSNALSKLTAKIIKKETVNKTRLENLCLKIVDELFAVPEEGIKLGCELLSEIPADGKLRVEPTDSEGRAYEDVASMENENSEIEKRKLLCAFITGIAAKLSDEARRKYMGDIFDIDEELPHLYSKSMKINDYLIFVTTDEISEKNHKQGGYADIKLGTDITPTEINAYGITFPILLYETIKGCLELFISHGLPDDIPSAKNVIEHADVLVNDPWYMRLGKTIYRYDIPSKSLPTFLMNVSQIPTEEFFNITKEIIAGTRKGETFVQQMLADVEHSDGYDSFQNDLVQKQQSEKDLVTDDCFTEQELEEAAYPSNFNMEEFKSMGTYAARVKYCQERLRRLGSGSGRIVYLIDNETVLKLARNPKGVAQNEVEGGDYYLRKIGLFPEVYDIDDNYLWIEMQRAIRAQPADFKRICGYGFNVVCAWVDYLAYDNTPPQYKAIFNSDEFNERLNDYDSVFYQLQDYIGNCLGNAVGDLKQSSSWGVIMDNGEERLVVVDYGLNKQVFNDYYKPKKIANNFY